jgi:hypothetical protein
MTLNSDDRRSVEDDMKRLILIGLLALTAPVVAQDAADEDGGDDALPTPAELAAESDYVLLAQLDVYEYERRREIPVSGSSWFDVLLPYKVPAPVERVKVAEEGFGEGKCYFDEADLWNEMPRYLLFLVDAEDEDGGNDGVPEVRGHPELCKVPVLATADNQYVVRWPLEGLRFEADVESLIEEFDFRGPAAYIDLTDRMSYEREAEVEEKQLELTEDGRYRYTRGIPLTEFRRLLGAENLTRDRQKLGF